MKTSLNIFLYSTLMLLCLISCKKDKKIEPKQPDNQELKLNAEYNNSIVSGVGNVFLEKNLLTNQKSQVFAKMAYKGDSIIFSGATNGEGKVTEMGTVVVAKGKNEYLVNQYLDGGLSAIMYRIKDGVKSSLVIKTQTSTEGKKEITFLDYDWKNGTAKVILTSYFLNEHLVDVQSSNKEKPSLTGMEVYGHSSLKDKKLAQAKGDINKVASSNTVTICNQSLPSGSEGLDQFLDKQLQFIACNGTHPINQPFLDLQSKINSLPNYSEIAEELEALKLDNSFFQDAFSAIKDKISKFKFERTPAGKGYAELMRLIEEYKASQGVDVRLNLLRSESDLEFNEGTDEFLKLTFLVTDVKKNAPFTDGSTLIEIRIAKPGADVASYNKSSLTRKADGKVTFLIKPEEITDLGALTTLKVFYGFDGDEGVDIFDVKLVWLTPTISMVSGNNQFADPGKKLAQPLKIKVVDQFNKPIKNWDVNWQVIEGNGFISSDSKTNELGIATADWTVGASGAQQVTASIKNKDGSIAKGAPITFNSNKANYVLEVQRYNPDYSQMVGLKELKNGDSFVTPNGLTEYFKVKLNGTYVKQSNNPGANDLVIRNFFYFPNYPVQSTDHKIQNYEFPIQDPQRNTESTVTLNLTLSNEIYRKVVGHSIRFVPAKYAGGESSSISMSFGSDGTYTEVSKSGLMAKYTYKMFTGSNTSSVGWFINCSSGGIYKSSIGYIDLGRPPSVAVPGRFIIVYSDGSLSLNTNYPCPEVNDNERITVSWE